PGNNYLAFHPFLPFRVILVRLLGLLFLHPFLCRKHGSRYASRRAASKSIASKNLSSTLAVNSATILLLKINASHGTMLRSSFNPMGSSPSLISVAPTASTLIIHPTCVSTSYAVVIFLP